MSTRERALGILLVWAVVIGGSSAAGLLTRMALDRVRPALDSELATRLIAALLVAGSMLALYIALERLSKRLGRHQPLWDWMIALHRGGDSV